eukprot:5060829-Alexandrium_andersonii.AAC.1
MRPDGYIKFCVWVGSQPQEAWAHRRWTVRDLLALVATMAGFDVDRAALVVAGNQQGLNPISQLDGVSAISGG